MDKKLLMICPTRNRPDKVMRMLASFKATKTFAEIVFYVANDDPRLAEYKENLKDERVIYGDRLPIASVFNLLSQEPGYDYYGEINDDHIIHTPGWDATFAEAIETRGKGWGLAYGFEANTPVDQPSGGIISAKCIRALGHYVTPYLEHLFVDWYFIQLYKPLGLLLRCPDVHIEHVHWCFKKAEPDENYKELYQDDNNYKRQEALWHKWVKENKESEIKTLEAAFNDDQNRRMQCTMY